MTHDEYVALITLLMVSDPYPCEGEALLKEFADRWALDHGYSNWIDAYLMGARK